MGQLKNEATLLVKKLLDLLALRARALAKFGEADTVRVSENSFN